MTGENGVKDAWLRITLIEDVLISKDFRGRPEYKFPFPIFFICFWAWNLFLDLGLSIIGIVFNEIGAQKEHLFPRVGGIFDPNFISHLSSFCAHQKGYFLHFYKHTLYLSLVNDWCPSNTNKRFFGTPCTYKLWHIKQTLRQGPWSCSVYEALNLTHCLNIAL